MIYLRVSILIILAMFSAHLFADVHVNSYQRSDGTTVQEHYRSNPDGNSDNNWSTKGNSNPYTGKEGTRNSENGSVFQNSQ